MLGERQDVAKSMLDKQRVRKRECVLGGEKK